MLVTISLFSLFYALLIIMHDTWGIGKFSKILSSIAVHYLQTMDLSVQTMDQSVQTDEEVRTPKRFVIISLQLLADSSYKEALQKWCKKIPSKKDNS